MTSQRLYATGSLGDCLQRYLDGKTAKPGPIADGMEELLHALKQAETGRLLYSDNIRSMLKCRSVERICTNDDYKGFIRAVFSLGIHHVTMVFGGGIQITKVSSPNNNIFPELDQKALEEVWPAVARWRATNKPMWYAFALAHENCDGSYCKFCLSELSTKEEVRKYHTCGI